MNKLIDQYREFVTAMTGLPVTCRPSVSGRLPQYLAARYSLYDVVVDQGRFLGICLNDTADFRPATFEKQLIGVMAGAPKELQGYCLIAERLPGYVRQRLIERRIPFVVPAYQMYWPALGVVVKARQTGRALAPVEKIDPAGQAVLILALTGGALRPITPKALAENLAYTTMTMTRALDKIEATGLGRVVREGRERLLDFPDGKQALWKAALPYLRNPVRKVIRLWKNALPDTTCIQAGETALAAMSMLAPPKEPVYAMGREGWKRIDDNVELVPFEEPNTCRVQLWRYDPGLFAKKGIVDPFSLYLTLRDEPDERVQTALQEMMDKHAWS